MFLMIIIIRVLQMVMQEIMVEYFIIDDHLLNFIFILYFYNYFFLM